MPVLPGAEPFAHDRAADRDAHTRRSCPPGRTAKRVVEPRSAAAVFDGLRGADLTGVALPRTSHVATLDHEAPPVFAGSVEPTHKSPSERVEECA